MKDIISRTALAATAAIAVCLGAPGNLAIAQSTVPNQAGTAQAPALSSGASEVMKLFQGGIPADIIVGYVNNSPLSFYLSADSLIALQQEGVPESVLTAMMRRHGEMQRQAGVPAGALAPVQAQNPVPQYAGAPAPLPAQAPAPQYYSYAPAQPAVSYAYVTSPSYPIYEPYYYDPYYYPWRPFGGPVVFGFGFGHVGGFGGHWGGGWRR